MLLAVDIGNTNIKFGLFEDTGPSAGTLLHTWRSVTNRRQTGDELAALVDGMLRVRGVAPSAVKRVVAANVVPHLYRAVTGMAQQYFHCRTEFISAARQTLMPVRTQRPAELGADLIANAIAAVKKYGAPVIIVGFGTATTFSGVGADGAFAGTAIAPGIEISVDALVGRAAKLMSVPLVRPASALGTDTVEALQSGIIFGFVGQADFLIAKIADELGGRPTVVATGGLAELVASNTKSIHHVDDALSLHGLYHWATTDRRASADPGSDGVPVIGGHE
ncbi:MAG TPA: type III pantothenate kinase [Candidatus Eremiobacteraceae bacterium]|nr:type III pantothenate kinase [Candidatus Eremiobacteraceae bacterium]